MRCGCTGGGTAVQCPPCPSNVWVDHSFGNPTILDLTSTTPSAFPIAIRPFNVPAIVPGFGLTAVAEFNAGTQGDQTALDVAWTIELDGTIIQNRQKIFWTGADPEWESASIVAGVQDLTPGPHTLVFNIYPALNSPGSGVLILFGGAMRTDLIRSPNLIVTP